MLELYGDSRLYLLWLSISTSDQPFVEPENSAKNTAFVGVSNLSETEPVSSELEEPFGQLDCADIDYNPLSDSPLKADASDSSSISSFDSSSTWSISSTSSSSPSTSSSESDNFKIGKILLNSSQSSSDLSSSSSSTKGDDFDEEAMPPLMQVRIGYISILYQMVRMFIGYNKMASRSAAGNSDFIKRMRRFLPQIPKSLFKAFSELRVIISNSQPEDFLFSSFLIPEQVIFARGPTVGEETTATENHLIFLNLVPSTNEEDSSDTDDELFNASGYRQFANISHVPLSKEDLQEEEGVNDVAVKVSLEGPKWRRMYKSSLRTLGYAMSVWHPVTECPFTFIPSCIFGPKDFINAITQNCIEWNLIKPNRRKLHVDILNVDSIPLDSALSKASNSILQTCFCSLGLTISCGKNSPGVFPWLAGTMPVPKENKFYYQDSISIDSLRYSIINQRMHLHEYDWIRYVLTPIIPSLSSIVSPSQLLFSIVAEGSPMAVLKNSMYIWNGSSSTTISPKLKNSIELAVSGDARNSLQVICYSLLIVTFDELKFLPSPFTIDSTFSLSWISYYRDNDPMVISNHKMKEFALYLSSKHTFLGMVGLAHKPRSEIPECLEDFSHAGIRFAYNCIENEIITRSFGKRLGLDSDWNSCIDLNDKSTTYPPLLNSGGHVSCAPGRSLPAGISSIRDHLIRVDNLPLLVSLFSSSSASETLEMISIYWEYNEIPLYWASSLSGSELILRSSAALSIVVDPMPRMRVSITTSDQSNGDVKQLPSFNLAFVIQRVYSLLSPSLLMKFNMKPYIITQMIREARLIQLNCELFLSAYSKLVLSYLVSSATLLDSMESYNSIVILLVFPLLSIILLFLMDVIPDETDIMKKLPRRAWTADHIGGTAEYSHCEAEYDFLPIKLISAPLKQLVASGGLIIIFSLCLHCSPTPSTSIFITAAFGVFFEIGSFKNLFTMNLTIPLCTFVIWDLLVFSIFSYFCPVSSNQQKEGGDILSVTNFYLLVSIFLWYFVDERFIHQPKRDLERKLQKLRKLEFNTRLGMHSPI